MRYPWAEDYRGKAVVVYGHTPVPDTTWINNTICLDTGAVFGGKMTALRWPERELVDVPAEKVWYEPVKPLAAEAPGGTTAARWTWPTCTGAGSSRPGTWATSPCARRTRPRPWRS